jgi:hypothetical protein
MQAPDKGAHVVQDTPERMQYRPSLNEIDNPASSFQIVLKQFIIKVLVSNEFETTSSKNHWINDTPGQIVQNRVTNISLIEDQKEQLVSISKKEKWMVRPSITISYLFFSGTGPFQFQ